MLYVGLDIAKSSLQLDLAAHSLLLDNDARGHAQLLKRLEGHPAARIVCEAAGGYARPVVRAVPHTGPRSGLSETEAVRECTRERATLRSRNDLLKPSLEKARGGFAFG